MTQTTLKIENARKFGKLRIWDHWHHKRLKTQQFLFKQVTSHKYLNDVIKNQLYVSQFKSYQC